MDLTLVNAIRTLGWPDANGNHQYGNAAILCYLSRYDHLGKAIIDRYKDMRVSDLVAKYA